MGCQPIQKDKSLSHQQTSAETIRWLIVKFDQGLKWLFNFFLFQFFTVTNSMQVLYGHLEAT